MGWVEKGTLTPFDQQLVPLTGLWYLDGDILAKVFGRDWTVGQKLPMVAFPSGSEFQLWESSNPDAGGIVHIYGEMDLAFKGNRDQAFEYATYVAEQCGYAVGKVGENGLKVRGQDPDEHFLITYDNEVGQMRDVARLEGNTEPPVHPGHKLMTDEIRGQLPQLGANEEQGLEAPAPVKYFTPDSNWTWYASEFDGDDLLFGLVIGFEIELGYFSLQELQSVRGPLGLKIERDLYYEAQTLRELQEQHRRERGQS